MLVVGAKLFGQASLSTFASRCTRDFLAIEDSLFPVIERIFFVFFIRPLSIRTISSVSPEFEIIKIPSFLEIAPRSPWLASYGLIKKEGVPVLDKVDEIFAAI